MLRATSLAVVLAGCGRVAFAPLTPDATPDAEPLGPFGPPFRIDELSTGSFENDPTLTPDGLEIVFASNRSGTQGSEGLWTASRATIDAPWSTPTRIAELDSAKQDDHPFLSADGLTIWFASDRAGGVGMEDLWTATRPTRASAWSTPTLVTELATTDSEEAPTVDAAGLVMFFSRASSAGPEAIFVTTRPTPTSAWGPAVPVSETASAAGEGGPALDGSLRTLYFDSKRTGAGDLYMATRPALDQPFTDVQPISELDSPSDADGNPWVSPDQHLIVFVRTISGNYDLYEARR